MRTGWIRRTGKAKSFLRLPANLRTVETNTRPNSDAYNARWGSGFFYEKQDAFDMYDARLSHILNYKGKYSGKVWKNWHDGIMGFDLQNEPMTTKPSECLDGDTHGWICGRAKHLRKVLGDKNPIKVATGGIGGDFSHQCNLISAATQCDALDLISSTS